jgi:hypothetical protein
MTLGDLVTATLILGAAGWLLYRSLFARKGGCHGCSSGACRPPQSGVVRLGSRPARPGADDARSGGAESDSRCTM